MRLVLLLLPLLGRGLGGGGALFAQADLEVCVGKGYTLSSTAANPPFGATTYQWYENSSPVGTNSASYIVTTGQAVANNYTYVRVASNVDCPDGIASNTYTVQVRAAGTAGEPATCGCVSGLIDCSSTCTTPHATSVDGACVTDGCRKRNVTNWTVCGIQTGAGTRTDEACNPNPTPTYSSSCYNNSQFTAPYNNTAAQCEENARIRAVSYCATSYRSRYSDNSCTTYYCY